jgi:DmsE family decaheme c-type cytochrome
MKGVAVTFPYLFKRLGAIGIAGVLLGFVGLTNVHAAAGAPDADVCKGCHEAYVVDFEKSIHGQKGHPRSPANAGGCSICHGDGAAHVNAGGGRGSIKNPASKKIPAGEQSAACLTCHEGARQLAFWDSGQHKKQDVSCNNCHSIHGPTKGRNEKLVKAGDATISPYVNTVRQLQYETCNNCHKSIRVAIGKNSHHPIIEGKVKCSDCHNPHGALSPAMVKAESVNDLCYGCHAEKRGPFIAEHPPVAENCLSCHTPHGSNHTRLLQQRMPLLCQDCHTGGSHLTQVWTQKDTFPPFGAVNVKPGSATATTTFAGSGRFVGRSCINCHINIHGSNAPSNQGQRFIR